MTDLELARSESTPQSELLRLLEDGTPSVRRAVAGNINAGPEVLKKASKLNCLDIVLKNKAFHYLALFSDDSWIKATYKVYENPVLGINSDLTISREYGAWAWADQRQFFAFLRILSPNLEVNSLGGVVRNISPKDFKKALKDKEVKEKIISLCNEALNDESVAYPLSLHALLRLYTFDLVSEKYVIKSTAHFGMGSTWVESSFSLGAVNRMVAKFESPSTTPEQKTSIINCFSSLLLVFRGSVYKEIGAIFPKLKESTIKELLIPVYRKISFVTERSSLIDPTHKIFKEKLLDSIQKNVPSKAWKNSGPLDFASMRALNAYLDSY
jgi:hypothetical protein